MVSRLKVQEGLRLRPYADSKGFPTICYGTRLPLTVAERVHVGVDRDLRDGLTEPECEWLLRGRVRINADAFTGRWRPYELQPFDVQVVLIDAAYQLGPTGLLAFETMLFVLSVGDYDCGRRRSAPHQVGLGYARARRFGGRGVPSSCYRFNHT